MFDVSHQEKAHPRGEHGCNDCGMSLVAVLYTLRSFSSPLSSHHRHAVAGAGASRRSYASTHERCHEAI